jgi:hypothetical protein
MLMITRAQQRKLAALAESQFRTKVASDVLDSLEGIPESFGRERVSAITQRIMDDCLAAGLRRRNNRHCAVLFSFMVHRNVMGRAPFSTALQGARDPDMLFRLAFDDALPSSRPDVHALRDALAALPVIHPFRMPSGAAPLR